MPTVNSSLIGANLTSSDATALFALGTIADASGGQRYQYVEATSTLITGALVLLLPTGTAKVLTTAQLTGGSQGIAIGAAQGLINQSEFGWIATQGQNLYVLCTGTVTALASGGAAFSTNSGRLENAAAVGVGATALGIWITTSASTATASVARATLTFPRSVQPLS
jgi:hypothetical protein